MKDFIKGNNSYPTNRQETLHLLDKCSKSVAVSQPASEGVSFAQRGGNGKGNERKWQRKKSRWWQREWRTPQQIIWKEKACYSCGKKERKNILPNTARRSWIPAETANLNPAATWLHPQNKWRNSMKSWRNIRSSSPQWKEQLRNSTTDPTVHGFPQFQFGMTNGSQRQGVQLGQMPNKPKDKQGFLFFQWMDEHVEAVLPEQRSSNKDDWPGSIKCDPATEPVNPRPVMQQSTGPKHKHVQENNDASQQWWQHDNDLPSNGRILSQESVVHH